MKQASTIELEEIIIKLDGLLIQGFNLFQILIKDYKERSDRENFDQEEYAQEKLDKINAWYPEVYKVLNESFELKHYLFHFINPKVPVGIALDGIPQKVSNLTIKLEHYLYALEDVILRLEERKNLAVRQQIAEKEYQADILYSISYSDHSREIKLNNVVLKKPDFNSENDNCFAFIYKNQGRPIGIVELEEAIGDKLKKRLAHIVRDLGFIHELKDIFFPVVTKNEVMFINPITKQYSLKHNLPPINFNKIGRQSKPE